MPVRENKVKQILASGGTILSSAVRLPEPGLCELFGYAGFDFVLIDGEHGAMDASTVDRMVQGAFAGATVPIVRVLRNDQPELVMHALDMGAQGILLPHCRTADDARRLQQAAYYPPRGNRGMGPGRGWMYGAIPTAEYLETIDDTIALLVLIEEVEGVENVEEIAATGVDVLWVGTSDLSASYGVPGQTDHPKVTEACERVVAACERNGIAAGFPLRKLEDIAWAKEKGFRCLGYGTAESYVMQVARQFLAAARE